MRCKTKKKIESMLYLLWFSVNYFMIVFIFFKYMLQHLNKILFAWYKSWHQTAIAARLTRNYKGRTAAAVHLLLAHKTLRKIACGGRLATWLNNMLIYRHISQLYVSDFHWPLLPVQQSGIYDIAKILCAKIFIHKFTQYRNSQDSIETVQ